MRKIAVITGTRAEYGILEPLIRKISDDKELELQLYVTGTHLLNEYGKTIDYIKYPITGIVDMKIKNENSGKDMGLSVAEGVKGFLEAFEKNKPEVIVILGDRIEPLAASLAALFLKIPIAHLNGGDLTFTLFDEQIRHAITKMASLHFPASELSKKRISGMGEEDWRIHDVGALGLDSVLNEKTLSKDELFKKYTLDTEKKTLLIVFHPVTTEWEQAGDQFSKVLAALNGFDCQKIIIYPNTDAGGYKIVDEIKKIEGKPDYFIYKSLPHEDYVSFMKASDVLIGNSSSGIIEAPSVALPVVNIGTRQDGRERASNIIDISYNPDEIKKAIEKTLNDSDFLEIVAKKQSPYGDGRAAEKIISVLKNVELNDKLIKKRMTY